MIFDNGLLLYTLFFTSKILNIRKKLILRSMVLPQCQSTA